ncbi:MAG TPA: methylenetetrahydrofolate reductase [Woeseiaceae bacterium]
MKTQNDRLRRTLESGHFAITAELTPPRGADFRSLQEAIAILGNTVTAVNVTDGAGARVRMSSLAAAIYVREHGLEPIMQMTCRDRNRLALQAEALGAAAHGIHNVLALTGDRPADSTSLKSVFDLDSKSLVSMLAHLSKTGTTLSGSELSSSPAFFIGVADSPVEPGPDWRPVALAAKQAAGARFVQTQYCYDPGLLSRYLERLAEFGLLDKLYFLVGLGPLPSAQAARRMREKLPGTVIPEGLIRRLEAARDQRLEGTVICAELIQQVREINGVAGVHLMAPGMYREMTDAIRSAGLT